MLVLAAASGIAALIYELVWFQLLELAIGSTAASLGLLLATFMGGMCAGSLLLPRLASTRRNPLRVYAALELGIGILGLLVLWLMPTTLHAASAVMLLAPPALLMGATLPALSRCLGDSSELGFLYGANIAGAVAGSLLAGFYLLREYDVATATFVAAAVNAAAAVIALMTARTRGNLTKRRNTALSSGIAGARGSAAISESAPVLPGRKQTGGSPVSGGARVYISVALSGLCALGAEAIWTRLLGLLLGASVYTLSIILAVFLTGLGIGSCVGSLLCRTIQCPRLGLAWCQLLATAAIAWAACCLSASLPYWPVNPSISTGVGFNFQLDLARAFWALLPATLLWGASFPVALAAASSSSPGDGGRLMAGIYSANTLGAIAGALGASLLLVPLAGSQHAQQVLIAVSALSALLLLPRPWITVPLVGALVAVLIHSVPPLAKELVAHGRYAASWAGKGEIVYAGEGLNSSVAVESFPNGVLTFHVAGKIQASNVPRDMRLQRMLGHLTTLTVEHPRSVLVIGCGAGITAGAVSIDPQVERETIAEIEPLVPHAAATYFGEPNFNVLHNPKVTVRIDDGRHFLLTTSDRFDGITIDPLDPWVKGAANLYTREFFETMKRHLNPGGTVTMYIQLFETTTDAVKSAVATFADVFPNGTLWGNTYQGQGHDMVLLGQAEPLRVDLDAMEDRFGYRDNSSQIPQSLAEVDINSPVDLFATYAGRASDLTEWLKGAAVNRDRNLRMEYLAGLGLNLDDAAAIYAGILKYRRFPEDIFTSAEGRVDSLQLAIQRQR